MHSALPVLLLIQRTNTYSVVRGVLAGWCVKQWFHDINDTLQFLVLWLCGSCAHLLCVVCFPGCDSDLAREAVNQMHRALLPHVGAEDRRLWKQTAPPARAGDAYSGGRRFPLIHFLCLLFCVGHAFPQTRPLARLRSCSVFQQYSDPVVIYQLRRSTGDSSHYTYPSTRTHTQSHTPQIRHMHILLQCLLHSNEVAGSPGDSFNIHTTQLRCEAPHVASTVAAECLRVGFCVTLDDTHNKHLCVGIGDRFMNEKYKIIFVFWKTWRRWQHEII